MREWQSNIFHPYWPPPQLWPLRFLYWLLVMVASRINSAGPRWLTRRIVAGFCCSIFESLSQLTVKTENERRKSEAGRGINKCHSYMRYTWMHLCLRVGWLVGLFLCINFLISFALDMQMGWICGDFGEWYLISCTAVPERIEIPWLWWSSLTATRLTFVISF